MNALLAFDPESHTYTWKGREVPSVTTVLARVGIINTDYLKEEAAWRGSVVHRVCELDDLGTLDESTVDAQALPYLEAWRKFKRETGFVAEEIERPRYDAHYGYAGTPDRIGRCKNSAVVIDLKTGAEMKHHKVQLAAYSHLLNFPWSRRRFVVRLKPDGSYIVPGEYSVASLREDFNVFLWALNIFNWKGEK